MVTIYYDELTDLFAIVDSKINCFLDFGTATEVQYAEIFAYNSSVTIKRQEICVIPLEKSKELQVYPE